VVEAANGDEALSVLEHSDLKIDLVFSDLEMPGSMDGFGLAQWLRRNRPDIGVILTGTPNRAAGAAAELCESSPTLSKPYEPQVVLDEIRRLLAERKRRK
jgi:CheY-like chemotaxis protein